MLLIITLYSYTHMYISPHKFRCLKIHINTSFFNVVLQQQKYFPIKSTICGTIPNKPSRTDLFKRRLGLEESDMLSKCFFFLLPVYSSLRLYSEGKSLLAVWMSILWRSPLWSTMRWRPPFQLRLEGRCWEIVKRGKKCKSYVTV